jgi:hypothetical protein
MESPRVAGSGVRFAIIRPEVRLIENSGFPFGSNDGAVWAGRGLTTSLHGGFEVRAGILTVTVDPIVFWAQNLSFKLEPTDPARPYNDPVTPGNIDLPQRFGASAYRRFDPGQSTIRVDAFGIAAGVTTANEIWGPAVTSPIILGNNAAGFERIFLGTARPVNVGIGYVSSRVFVGRLSQSAYSPTDSSGGKRLAAGMVAAFEPTGLHGLEFGFTRFFHRFWPVAGLRFSDLSIPFDGFFHQSIATNQPNGTGIVADNQLASFFSRLRLPKSGLELYGEYGREDHSWDIRDLAGEPDHISAYTLGLLKVFDAPTSSPTVLRAEVTNSRVTKLVLGRGEGLFYEHGPIVQGHTQLGQLLGSPAVRGGGGATLAIDRYSPEGRVSLTLTRTDRATEEPGGLGFGATTSLLADLLRFHRGVDLTARLGLIHDAGVKSANDRTQVTAAVGARLPLGF